MVDYFSFEDVMKELELSEEDLKRMVSEGELRAFRDENKMKFRREDVDHLKKGRITEPTIILPSTPGGGTDETVLDLDISQETANLKQPAGRTPPAPNQASDDDLLVTTPTEEINVQNDETFVDEESDTGLQTEPLRLADEVETAETIEEDPGETETLEADAVPAKKGGRAGRRRRAAAASAPAAEDEVEAVRAHPAWTGLMVASLVLTLYSGAFVADLLAMESGRADQPGPLTAGMASWAVTKFWEDPAWRKFHERNYPEGGARKPPFESLTGSGTRIPHREYKGPTFRESDLPKPVATE